MRNTELLLSFEEVKRNKEEIVPRISEGNPILESIIMLCVDRNIPTIACCNGHTTFDKPYLTIVYNKDTRRNINAFLNKLKSIKGIEIMFSSTGFTNNPFNVTIYANMRNRDTVFGIINETLIKDDKSEYLDSDLEDMVNVAIDLDYNGKYGTVSILNKTFRTKYMLGLYRACEGNLFEDHSYRKIKADYGMTYYLYRTTESFRLASKDYETLIPEVHYRKAGFKISTTIPVSEKVDRISELNDKLKDENGTIKRF